MTHMINYLMATRTQGIEYSAHGIDLNSVDLSDVLETMSDASYADDIESRHSSQGYVIMLFNGMIT